MRNLKKILALVLALVMSLSLMATAGATDFKDDDQFTETYKTAAQVLEKLGVLKGDPDGSFRPTGSITRAEAAAAVYRIVTGDVNDTQKDIYADYNIFSDVQSGDWYAGYVNFCANAEYIKGNGDGTFSPNEQVSGYAVLAMILRAIGYTANGGFTGDDWAVQTARTAEARRITKNVLTGTLGQPAPRETVAELLYQAIMVNMVDHNQDNTFNGNQGYFEKSITLGQQTFGLEKVSGVILANEWANLETDTVLDAGKTKMVVTKITTVDDAIATVKNVPTIVVGKELTLDAVAEDDMQGALDAVGMTYDAHIATKNGNLVASLEKSDVNVVADNEGKGVYTANKDNNWLNNATYDDVADLADSKGLELTKDTEWFINYSDKWDDEYTSEYLIRYAIAKGDNGGLTADETAYLTGIYDNTDPVAGHTVIERNVTFNYVINAEGNPQAETLPCWVVAIRPGAVINKIDLGIMEKIFYTADRIGNNYTNVNVAALRDYAIGEVYVGTTSMTDYSDTMSWNEFKAEYFNVDVNTEKFDTCEIGNSLRVIDNNNDGNAEYVLKIEYTQDKVIGTYKNEPAGYNMAIGSKSGNLLYNPKADEIGMGTVFNYTVIDKKLYVWPALVVTGVAANKNFNKITVTVDGEVYNQSGIKNDTRLDETIMLMDQGTTYNMYMDVYNNNIRSYELAQGSKWALLTEMYPTSDKNGNYIREFQAVAEVKIQDADVEEYPVNGGDTNNSGRNLFFNPYIWTWANRNYFGVNAGIDSVISAAGLYNANYLQPAVAHLGIGAVRSNNNGVVSPNVRIGETNNQPTDVDLQFWTADWNRVVAQAEDYDAPFNGNGGLWGVFNYGTHTDDQGDEDPTNDVTNPTFSFTNVAAYVENDGALRLSSASKLAADRVSGAQLYRIAKNISSTNGASYEALNGCTRTDANASAWERLVEWAHGTEAELLAAFDTVHGITDPTDTQAETWFNKWTGVTLAAGYQNGTGIYPVYESDYVALDLTKGDMSQALNSPIAVKAGTRHYHIAGGTDANGVTISNYTVDYNANGNQYVDATVNTEFYIVLPGGKSDIQYKLGYSDLPTIEASKIRAAYAVAHNTSAQSDGQDYWVADVIVIELTDLYYDYQSISLVYNNPYVQNGYTRWADTLNNQWRSLQPDFDDKAMMGVTPKDGFTANGWGDYSWSTLPNDANYGFWKLYRTELTEPGQLSAGDVKKITKDYNDFGIYAGQIRRVEELESSGYLDVWTQNTGSGFTHLIDVNYGQANEVPVYRVDSSRAQWGTIFTASQINTNERLRWSDVKNGDQIIWVYNQAKNEVAFIVDMGSRTKGVDSFNYTAPAWLFDKDDILDLVNAPNTTIGSPTSLYGQIVKDEHAAPAPVAKEFTISFASKTAVGDLAIGDVVYTVKADKGENVLVPMTNLNKTGYTTGAVEIGGVAVANDGTNYVIPNVQGNVTIDVTYTVDQKTLAVTEDATSTAGDATNIKVDNAAVPANMQVGKTFTVTFTGVADFTYTYTVNGGDPVAITMDGTAGSFEVEMPNANTTILITDAPVPKATVALDANAGTGSGITFDPAGTSTFKAGQTAVFSLTAPTAAPNIIKVWYTVAGELGQTTLTARESDGKYELPITANMVGKTVTVWMTAVAAKYALTIDDDSVTTIAIANDGTAVAYTGAADVSTDVNFGKSVTITSTNGDPLFITVAAGATVGTDLKISGEGEAVVTISDLYKAATITVTNTNPNA